MRLDMSWVLVSFSPILRQFFVPILKFQNDFLKVTFPGFLYVLDIHSVWHRGFLPQLGVSKRIFLERSLFRVSLILIAFEARIVRLLRIAH